MAVGDVYRAEIHQNVGSEPTMNVLHVRETVSNTGDENAVAEQVTEIIVDLYRAIAACMSEDWRVVMINCHKIQPTTGIPSSLVFGGAEAIVGEIEDQIIPSQCAVLVSLYTSTNNRHGRGRFYLPGAPEESQNEGMLVESAWTDFQAAVSPFMRTEKGPKLGGDAKFKFIVLSSEEPQTAQNEVIQITVRPNLATQKRRRAFPGFGA